MTGLVFDIQRFSIHDGPGIRTTVFMKGCSLDCSWCHNPESISIKKDIQTYFAKCIGCGKCFEVCPTGAHAVINGERIYNRTVCKRCGKCAEECYSGALVVIGEEMSIDEVVNEINADILFFKDSGGGVTFSGGEPLLQSEFVAKALAKCREKGIHTAVDTAGNVPFSSFEKVIPYTDLFLYDLKIMNQDEHKKFTGADNGKILENLEKLDGFNLPIIIRIPVITGVNDYDDNFIKTADYISNLENIEAVELLAYHSLGAGKLESLGISQKDRVFKTPSKNRMNEICSLFSKRDINVINKNM